jgi:hypothetical protein
LSVIMYSSSACNINRVKKSGRPRCSADMCLAVQKQANQLCNDVDAAM